MNTNDVYRAAVAGVAENLLLERLFFASLEFAALALFVGLLIAFCRRRASSTSLRTLQRLFEPLQSPRLAALVWLLVLAKPLVSLAVGSPIPIIQITIPAPLQVTESEGAVSLPPQATSVRPAAANRVTAPPSAVPEMLAPPPAYPVAEPAIEARPSGEMASLPPVVVPADAAERSRRSGWSVAQLALALWLFGVFWRTAIALRRQFRLWSIVAAGQPPAAPLAARLADLAAQMGLRKVPRLRVTGRLESPALAGVWSPVILVPAWMAHGGAKPSTLEWSLRHELTHWKLGDPLANVVCEVSQILFFFHPAAWWAGKRWHLAMELACDRALVSSEAEAVDYAHGLYEVLAAIQNHRRLALSGSLFATRTQIGQRIDLLLNAPLSQSARLSAVTIAALCVLSVVSLSVGSQFAEEQSQQVFEAEPPAGNSQSQPDGAQPPGNELQEGSQGDALTSLSGRVLDPDGKPVVGAELAVFVWSHQQAHDGRPLPPIEVWARSTSDSEGRYGLSFPRPPSADYYTKRAYQIALLASREAYGLGLQFLSFDADERTVDVQLRPEQLRYGRIIDLEGRGVGGVSLHLVRVGKPAPKMATFRRYPFHHGLPLDEVIDTQVPVAASASGENAPLWEEEIRFREPPRGVPVWPRPVLTDEDGRFVVRGLPPDSAAAMFAYGTDRVATQEIVFAPGSGAERAPEPFVGDTPRLVEGTITDASTGEPVAGAKVRIDTTGVAVYYAFWPVLSDWKGRQNSVQPAYALPNPPPLLPTPGVHTVADERGRYQLSPFPNSYGPQTFAVTVSGPDDRPYVAVKRSIRWPRDASTTGQQVDVALPPGVRVRGKVVDGDTGQPIERARIDFWSRELPYPAPLVNELKLRPDGVQHPVWRKADFGGRFELVVPVGRSYLLVNGGSDDFLIDSVSARQLGVDVEFPEMEGWLGTMGAGIGQPPREGREYRFYPDRLVELDLAEGYRTEELIVELRRAPRLQIQALDADGKPATGLTYFGGQAPFKEPSQGGMAPIRKTAEDRFELPVRDPQAPICVVLVDAARGIGAAAELIGDPTGGPQQMRLAPLGSATARFIDTKGEPLADYRPLVWLSLPRRPLATPRDLERLAMPQTVHAAEGEVQLWPLQQTYDMIWLGETRRQPYGTGPRTDIEGRVTLPALIPDATYLISQFGGQARQFSVASGEQLDLGEIVIHDPQRTKGLPRIE